MKFLQHVYFKQTSILYLCAQCRDSLFGARDHSLNYASMVYLQFLLYFISQFSFIRYYPRGANVGRSEGLGGRTLNSSHICEDKFQETSKPKSIKS